MLLSIHIQLCSRLYVRQCAASIKFKEGTIQPHTTIQILNVPLASFLTNISLKSSFGTLQYPDDNHTQRIAIWDIMSLNATKLRKSVLGELGVFPQE